jgi:hypothetical protein
VASSTQVEILIAQNTMTSTVSQNSFDSDIHLKDLDWISIGVVSNSGSANLVMPGIVGKSSFFSGICSLFLFHIFLFLRGF